MTLISHCILCCFDDYCNLYCISHKVFVLIAIIWQYACYMLGLRERNSSIACAVFVIHGTITSMQPAIFS